MEKKGLSCCYGWDEVALQIYGKLCEFLMHTLPTMKPIRAKLTRAISGSKA